MFFFCVCMCWREGERAEGCLGGGEIDISITFLIYWLKQVSSRVIVFILFFVVVCVYVCVCVREGAKGGSA